MRTSSVSEGAKIEHINLRKRQKLHTPKLNTNLPNKIRQNIPTPKFPNLRYIVHGLTFAIFQSY